jgi:cytochrome P450
MMVGQPQADWDPRSDAVQQNQLAAYDDMRERCPVAYSDFLGWSLFRHSDVVRVLRDPQTFSSVVSSHRAVPSGMDPPEHTEFRRVVERYFQPEFVEPFEPCCRQIAAELVQTLAGRGEVEFSGEFAHPFAVQVQCEFLGWPAYMREPLHQWTLRNHGATFLQDRVALAQMAEEFEGYVDELLQSRRDAGPHASDDITTRLMHEQVNRRGLNDEEIVSVLRNWTAGEVGTISAAVGILAFFLATRSDVQAQLRDDPTLLPAAIEEILRLHGPLVANRRITTRPVEIGGRAIGAGERISLNWIAANRDGRVFHDPREFQLHRDQSQNLLYGAGIHVCPGAPLARLELRLAMEELLGGTRQLELVASKPPRKATYPASGYSTLHLRIA